MTMNSKHNNYKLRAYEFKPKYSKEDIDIIKQMKADGKQYADIYYVMLQRFTDPKTQELKVSPNSIARWINKN